MQNQAVNLIIAADETISYEVNGQRALTRDEAKKILVANGMAYSEAVSCVQRAVKNHIESYFNRS